MHLKRRKLYSKLNAATEERDFIITGSYITVGLMCCGSQNCQGVRPPGENNDTKTKGVIMVLNKTLMNPPLHTDLYG